MNLIINIAVYILPMNKKSPYYGKAININNVKEFNVNSGWDELMSTGEVVISRKMKDINVFNLKEQYAPGDYRTWVDDNEPNINQELSLRSLFGGFSGNTTVNGASQSIIQRGDIITVVPIYSYTNFDGSEYFTNYNLGSQTTQAQNELYATIENKNNAPRSQIFTGYITSIKSGYEARIQMADFMYFFNQLGIPNKKYITKEYKTLNGLMSNLIDKAIKSYSLIKSDNKLIPIWSDDSGDNFSIQNYEDGNLTQNIDSTSPDSINNATLGDILCENATFGMVMKELKNKYMMVPFFYPNSNWLNILPFKYESNEFGALLDGEPDVFGYQQHIFAFQKNIIVSNLDYRKKEDILVGAYIKSVYKLHTSDELADGTEKTKVKALQYFVGQAGGDIKTFFYDRKDIIPLTDADATKKDASGTSLKDRMIARGKQLLEQTIYTGYYGSFITFGYPYVRHGDKVNIIDDLYPERNGVYRVKRVKYYGGESTGLRQEITIDIKE